ncbi:MAG: hypothetical protein D6819_00945 [Gammaproteobacteria bacterium]|nr:MAG: hypothetical protein D6819_00945 [Gammaproteobacteria bacterium]
MRLLLAIPAWAAYLGATVTLAMNLMGRVRVNKALPLAMAFLGLCLHGIVAYHFLFPAGGVDLHFFNALSLTAWLITLLWGLMAITQPLESLGIAILPVAALSLALQMSLGESHTSLRTGNLGVDLHILLSMLAYSVLSIAALQAILLAIQEKHLREKHPGGFIRALPPLQVMEKLLFRLIAIGFVLLTFALIAGALYVENLFAQHLVHKTVLSIIAWCVFAVLLWGRWRFGWRGRTAIRWTLGGFFFLMLAYFGSKWVLEIALHR